MAHLKLELAAFDRRPFKSVDVHSESCVLHAPSKGEEEGPEMTTSK